jgi:hypothetical protein
MPSEQQVSWGVEQLLDNLSQAKLVLSRREAARELGTLAESNERIVRALLDARDTDDDEEVRREAAQALTAAPHREVIRKNIALAMRAEQQAEGESTVFFEAWESGPEGQTGAERWIVELTDANAVFTKETSREKISITGEQAGHSIVASGAPSTVGEGAGLSEGRLTISVEGRNLALSRTGYGKLMDWMEKNADRTNVIQSNGRISWWGVGLLAMGGLQLALSGGFSPFWGVVFLILGGINLVLPPQKMVFPNGLALMAGGLWYILFAGPGYSFVGYLPGVWGTLKIIDFYRGR